MIPYNIIEAFNELNKQYSYTNLTWNFPNIIKAIQNNFKLEKNENVQKKTLSLLKNLKYSKVIHEFNLELNRLKVVKGCLNRCKNYISNYLSDPLIDDPTLCGIDPQKLDLDLRRVHPEYEIALNDLKKLNTELTNLNIHLEYYKKLEFIEDERKSEIIDEDPIIYDFETDITIPIKGTTAIFPRLLEDFKLFEDEKFRIWMMKYNYKDLRKFIMRTNCMNALIFYSDQIDSTCCLDPWPNYQKIFESARKLADTEKLSKEFSKYLDSQYEKYTIETNQNPGILSAIDKIIVA